MFTQTNWTSNVITEEYLSTLNKSQLLNLMQHWTQLLISAKNCGLVSPDYINNVKDEIEKIQAQLKTKYPE